MYSVYCKTCGSIIYCINIVIIIRENHPKNNLAIIWQCVGGREGGRWGELVSE